MAVNTMEEVNRLEGEIRRLEEERKHLKSEIAELKEELKDVRTYRTHLAVMGDLLMDACATGDTKARGKAIREWQKAKLWAVLEE